MSDAAAAASRFFREQSLTILKKLSILIDGGRTAVMYLAWAVAILAGGMWLAWALLVVTRRRASLLVRLRSVALGFMVPLGLWGLFSFGPGLARRASQFISHEVDLSWNAPIDSARPISGYHVYRAEAGTSSYQLLNWSVVTETKFVDLTVKNGHTYNYVVKSVDAVTGIESGPSNMVRVTIPWMPRLAGPSKKENH